MLLFWKLIEETQMSKTPEASRHHPSEPFSFHHFNVRRTNREQPTCFRLYGSLQPRNYLTRKYFGNWQLKKNLQISYEDCILKITFDDEVQKYTDFLWRLYFEDHFSWSISKMFEFFMKIVFWRSLFMIKFKNLQIFYEDCILKITFHDQVQNFLDFLWRLYFEDHFWWSSSKIYRFLMKIVFWRSFLMIAFKVYNLFRSISTVFCCILESSKN